MIVFFLLYTVLILWGIKFVRNDKDVLSFNQTNALKGIGIMTVFFNHIYNGYLTPHGVLRHSFFDLPFIFFEETFTGLFVGMFLFFSGYGVYESYKKKGDSYINQMPVKRIGTTLLNFDIAVLVFLVSNQILGVSLLPKDVALSFVAWESIGNSNWYIFAILFCYLANYLSFKLAKSKKVLFVIICALTAIFMLLMFLFKQPWWYNTILCYPAGLLYSELNVKINKIFQKKYILSLSCAVVSFLLFYIGSSNPLMYNVAGIAFVFICILVSMRVRLNSQPLIWMGAHLFPLYIYQRLPMLMIDKACPEIIINTPPPYTLLFVF